MILEISASELTVTQMFGDEINEGFVRGAVVRTSNGARLFRVSGSDEFTATINGVESYVINEHQIAQVVLQETL